MSRRAQQPTTASPAGTVTRYRDRIFDDKSHDPYQSNDASISDGKAKYLVDQE